MAVYVRFFDKSYNGVIINHEPFKSEIHIFYCNLNKIKCLKAKSCKFWWSLTNESSWLKMNSTNYKLDYYSKIQHRVYKLEVHTTGCNLCILKHVEIYFDAQIIAKPWMPYMAEPAGTTCTILYRSHTD